MNKISSRQLYFFLACVAPVGKLVLMPSQLVYYTKNDLLFPVLIQYLVQAAIIFCALLLAKRGKNLFELFADAFGRVVATILVLLLSLFLLYAAFLPLLEQKIFVQAVFYDTLPSLVAFAPFFLLSAYLCSKPLASYGRTWDILGPIAIAGIAGILVFSVGSAEYGALLPAGASGADGIMKGTAYITSWFFDSALILVLLGKFDYRKGMAWKGALWYLAGGAALLFFLATFYAIFAETAINQLFAFTETSKFFSGITVLGRVDYIFIFALALVMIFYCALPLQASVDCVVQAFGRKKYLPTLISVGINLLFFILTYVFDYRFGYALQAVAVKFFWIFPIFTVALPPLCLLLRGNRRA